MSTINELTNHRKFDVWLFAVDLVNYVFFKSSKLPSELIFGQFPGFVCKGFSENLKRAVELIRDNVKPDVDKDFAKFQSRNDFTSESYTKYAEEFRKARFRDGFEAENFLYYSVHVAYLAFRLCHGGVREAQISAVFCIAKDFQGSSTNYGLWEAFDEIAREIVHGSTNWGNVLSYPRGTATDNVNFFETPEISHKAKGIASGSKVDAHSGGESMIDPSPKNDCFSESLSNSKQYNREFLPCSCKRVMAPIEEYRTTDHKRAISLEESLESSLEHTSSSSTLSVKLVKVVGRSNSTPADFNVKWKHGILKGRISGGSFEKQMIKLSPINRIKAESVGFK